MGKNMKFNNRLFILIIIGICLLFPSTILLSKEMNNIEIEELEPISSDDSSKGYLVSRFEINNFSDKKQTLHIVYTDSAYKNGLEVTKQVELIADESREERIFLPSLNRTSRPKFSFWVDGKKIKEFVVEKRVHSYGSYYGNCKKI